MSGARTVNNINLVNLSQELWRVISVNCMMYCVMLFFNDILYSSVCIDNNNCFCQSAASFFVVQHRILEFFMMSKVPGTNFDALHPSTRSLGLKQRAHVSKGTRNF